MSRPTAKVVDISARNREDGAESRARNARIAAIQKRARGGKRRAGAPADRAPAARGARPRRRRQDGSEPEPLGYADLVGAQGGLTALLLAVARRLEDTAFALLDGGADINQVSASDRTSPLLMATINGHFDLAMRLLARGADVTDRERRRRDAALRRAQHAVGAEGAPSAAGATTCSRRPAISSSPKRS